MEQVWWNHIIKANKFKKDIIESIIEGKSVILSLPQNVPWKETLIELISNELRMENPKNAFERISCPEEEVGYYLLNKYCKKEKRATYRYGMTYAAFLGKSEDIVLNDRYIWVSDIPNSKYNEWIEFIVEYNKHATKRAPAVFVLETQDDTVSNKTKQGMKHFVFEQNIGAYDKFAFCALAATENQCKEYMRSYLAELVSSICNEDIELCAACVKMGIQFLKNPVKVIQKIVNSSTRSDGTPFQFKKNEKEIQQCIWETQLKQIFPLVEKYRNKFISRYHGQIHAVLPVENSFGEIVTEPYDLEIGNLVHMIYKGMILVNAKEREELECCVMARNKLAHLEILESEKVEQILWKLR